MPHKTIENFIGFLRQNYRLLSNRPRNKEFASLTYDELGMIEKAYAEIFKN